MRALLLLLLIVLALLAGRDIHALLYTPLPLQRPEIVEIPRGGGLSGLLRGWQERGLLGPSRQRLYLSAYARLSGQARAIKAGEYEVAPGMRPVDLIALLASGKVLLHELRLVEGWTFAQALQAVRDNPMLQQTLTAYTPAAVMTALGKPELHPEGRFYPDTYKFARGTSDLAFLQRAFTTMEQVLAAEWAQRSQGVPYRNADEALVMASIVERETGVPAERAEIAGVFVRRLQKGMRLQTDPSVIYGLGASFDGNLRRRDLLSDTPYNTYTRAGLPPTPICLPGRAAIHAALHPAAGQTLYFVSRGDGSHHFSETIAEHNAAVRKYQLKRRK